MPSTIALKRRIKSVKNTKQITKAMQLVAASKMRRAQESAVASRAFFVEAQNLLRRLSAVTKVDNHPLFANRQIQTKLYILLTSDRGLAGAYNSNLNRTFINELRKDQEAGLQSKVILIGKQGAKMAARIEGLEVVASFHELPQYPKEADLAPIINTVLDLYAVAKVEPPKTEDEDSSLALDSVKQVGRFYKNVYRKLYSYVPGYKTAPTNYQDFEIDQVVVIYTDFKSSVSQTVKASTILPSAFEPTQNVETTVDSEDSDNFTIFDPNPEVVLEAVAKRMFEVQLWQMLLESQASEHSMRMIAMKTATDNASEIASDLTLELNTLRQAAITQELAEITGGASAISG